MQNIATRLFMGVVDHDGPGYRVVFPDFPGCVATADTLFDALVKSEHALAAHLHLLVAHGKELPESVDEPEQTRIGQGVCRFVARIPLAGKSLRLNITMDEALIPQHRPRDEKPLCFSC